MKNREDHKGRQRSEYKIWAGIIQRCRNPKNPNYFRYGGNGIDICDEWRDSFPAFLAAVGTRPSSAHSIDRINNATGYAPGNVRWTTPREQAQNQSTTRFIEAFGERLCLAEWARKKQISIVTLFSRLDHLGWSPERAIATPSLGRVETARKLTERQVSEIRRRAALGESGKTLARQFRVNHTTACRVIAGKSFSSAIASQRAKEKGVS